MGPASPASPASQANPVSSASSASPQEDHLRNKMTISISRWPSGGTGWAAWLQPARISVSVKNEKEKQKGPLFRRGFFFFEETLILWQDGASQPSQPLPEAYLHRGMVISLRKWCSGGLAELAELAELAGRQPNLARPRPRATAARRRRVGACARAGCTARWRPPRSHRSE